MEKHSDDKLLIVIPAYNEEENIRRIVESWYPIVERIGKGSKLIIVDDGSRDKTYGIMMNCIGNHPHLVPLKKENGGHGSAILYGYNYALNIIKTHRGGVHISNGLRWADRS